MTVKAMDAIVREWLEKVRGEDRAEMEALAADGNALRERFGSELKFGTGGLRGIVGMGTACMNVYTVGRASRGLAAYMRAHALTKIAVSYDSRRKSQLFAQTAARIFAESGIRVVIVRELMPTPFLSFLTRSEKCGMGVMITASHNPAAYNGYKVYNAAGCQITDGAAAEVASFIAKEPYFTEEIPSFDEFVRQGAIVYADESVEEAYLAGIRAAVPADLRGLKVAYTALNGTGYRLVPELLRGVGAEVVPVAVQCVPDENFTTCPYPNPEKREALTLGLETAQENGCDLLVATDPDADRVGIAVRCGERFGTLTGNEVGLLLAQYLFEEKKRAGADTGRMLLIKTIVTTSLAERIAADYGAGVINVLTGFKYIGEQIGLLEAKGEADRFLLGFEESYGYLIGTQVRDKDALVASLAILKMAKDYAGQGRTLKDALDALYERYGRLTNTLLTYECGGADGRERIAAAMRTFRDGSLAALGGKPIVRRTDYLHDETGLPKSDVLYFDLGDSENVVVRPSGTEPNLKIYLALRGGAAPLRAYFDEILGQKSR